ncbi:hypothetical protein [Sulfurimonas sp. NWX367]|uniref:hypothetical protein n=1 Tax=Sulfurimonas sp. NWX367 TaxID=2925413 RepID=UPI003204BCF6
MALVTTIKLQKLERDSKHNEVECTYTIIENEDGKFLQIDTYGSENRQIKGKKSQSIRFSKDAINQLKNIIEKLELL